MDKVTPKLNLHGLIQCVYVKKNLASLILQIFKLPHKPEFPKHKAISKY